MVKFYYMSDFRFKNGKVSIISVFRQCEKARRPQIDEEENFSTQRAKKKELAFLCVAWDGQAMEGIRGKLWWK